MDEAVDADRVLVMDQGQIAMDGTPKEVFSRVEELQKLELDVPQITELAAETAGDAFFRRYSDPGTVYS